MNGGLGVFAVRALEHFKLHLLAAVHRLLYELDRADGLAGQVRTELPFLEEYARELEELVPAQLTHPDRFWLTSLSAWEQNAQALLPLRIARLELGLDFEALILLLTVGLSEEDARFSILFEALQGPGHRRPTSGMLFALFRKASGDIRETLRRLRELGFLRVLNPDASRLEWTLEVPAPIWDALRGAPPQRPWSWAELRRRDTLPRLADLVLCDRTREAAQGLQKLFEQRELKTMVVRGPRHAGRKTLVRAIANSIGYGVLELDGVHRSDVERWQQASIFASLVRAMPVVTLNPGIGETVELDAFSDTPVPTALVLGKHGGLSGTFVDRAATLMLSVPGPEQRRLQWRAALPGLDESASSEFAERFRLPAGQIHRVAATACMNAGLEGRTQVTTNDVQIATRTLSAPALEVLATRLDGAGDWEQLIVGPDTLNELRTLELRCRHREQLRIHIGRAVQKQFSCGVRALFSGPSGVGKTLAARVLAGVLQKDVYRVDLSAVVNKYIGETEKNLQQLFALAEELDVVLLLDEGDSLMTRRTGVQTANDRYANLETNYLLQRVENYDGIVFITTNAPDSIDSAFQRRMDAVIDFPAPGAPERLALWQLHLPANHAVDAELLQEVASRCALTGGQIRNVVLHAATLCLTERSVVDSRHLESAVRREYRRVGSVCPLRVTAVVPQQVAPLATRSVGSS